MIRNAYERSQRERVQNGRSRRSSIAQLLHDRAHADDEESFSPTYEEEDPDAVDPTNLASALGGEDIAFYQQMVRIPPTQAEPTAQAPLGGMNAP